VEASTLQAPAALTRNRIAIGTPLLRLRSDEQLVALFRAGHDEAFRAIHDRYEKRLLAYARQMLPRGQDAEDALQDVFVRAYSGLRSSERELALRAWLFRVAHNRCIDELRRPTPPPPEVLQLVARSVHDPVAEADRRESLRRLIVDVRRLPDQQRSALLMREMGGMSYQELAGSLGTSVPAVKSLLVRARIALAQAAAARDTACSEIREELAGAHDRGVRPNATAKRHMRDCSGCRSFRRELRSVNRQLAALLPLGPLGMLAKTLGLSSGAGAGGSATASGAGAGGATASGAGAAGGGAAAIGGASGGGAVASGALVVGSGHVATLLAAAVATASGAVAISGPPSQPAHARPAITRNADALYTQQGGLDPSQISSAQAAAATAAGTALVTQAKARSAAQAATGRPPRAPRPGRGSTMTSTPASSSSSDSSSAGLTDPGSSVTATLAGGSDPSGTETPSTGTDPSTSSSGSSPQSGDTGSSTSGSPSSDGSSSGSTGTTSPGSTGSTTGTTNGTNSGASGSGTGTGGTSSSGSGTSTSGTGSSSTTSGSGSTSSTGSPSGTTAT
jgi:RNA polymerase sigma factor (sigma-70 family)